MDNDIELNYLTEAEINSITHKNLTMERQLFEWVSPSEEMPKTMGYYTVRHEDGKISELLYDPGFPSRFKEVYQWLKPVETPEPIKNPITTTYTGIPPHSTDGKYVRYVTGYKIPESKHHLADAASAMDNPRPHVKGCVPGPTKTQADLMVRLYKCVREDITDRAVRENIERTLDELVFSMSFDQLGSKLEVNPEYAHLLKGKDYDPEKPWMSYEQLKAFEEWEKDAKRCIPTEEEIYKQLAELKEKGVINWFTTGEKLTIDGIEVKPGERLGLLVKGVDGVPNGLYEVNAEDWQTIKGAGTLEGYTFHMKHNSIFEGGPLKEFNDEPKFPYFKPANQPEVNEYGAYVKLPEGYEPGVQDNKEFHTSIPGVSVKYPEPEPSVSDYVYWKDPLKKNYWGIFQVVAGEFVSDRYELRLMVNGVCQTKFNSGDIKRLRGLVIGKTRRIFDDKDILGQSDIVEAYSIREDADLSSPEKIRTYLSNWEDVNR